MGLLFEYDSVYAASQKRPMLFYHLNMYGEQEYINEKSSNSPIKLHPLEGIF